MRIQRNYGQYDIVSFSYVITPLNEQESLNRIINGFLKIESLCNPIGKVLILQDKFKETLMRKIASAIGKTYKKQELSQYVYSSNNSNETHTYTYFNCLFSPQVSCQGVAIAV
jgi:type I site-specific restriction-modification system R (restriction) subunit